MKNKLTALGAVAFASAVLGACTSQQNSPPFARALPELRTAEEKRGEIVFMHNCNQCHPGGAGGLGPALNNKPAPGPAIMLVVRAGPGEMPRFSEKDLSDYDVKSVAAYVVALRHADNDAEDAAEARKESASR